MKRKHYDLAMLFILLFIATAVALILVTGEKLITAATLVIIAAVSFGMRQKFRSDIVEDERVYQIRARSSRAAIITFVSIAAIPSFAFVILGKDGNSVMLAVGYTLQACIAFLLFVDVIAYYILNRKQMD